MLKGFIAGPDFWIEKQGGKEHVTAIDLIFLIADSRGEGWRTGTGISGGAWGSNASLEIEWCSSELMYGTCKSSSVYFCGCEPVV